MSEQPFIDRLVADIGRRLPSGLGALREEVEHTVQAVLREAVTRLDLVGREEFEVQQQVLARTRARLEQLEQEVRALEQRLAP